MAAEGKEFKSQLRGGLIEPIYRLLRNYPDMTECGYLLVKCIHGFKDPLNRISSFTVIEKTGLAIMENFGFKAEIEVRTNRDEIR